MDDAQSLADSKRNQSYEMPMFPLGTVLLPGAVLPLHIFEERYRQMMDFCIEHESDFGVVLIERGNEVGGGDTRSMVGTAASIVDHQRFSDGRWAVHALGRSRIEITDWLEELPYPKAMVRGLRDELGGATLGRAHSVLQELSELTQQAVDMGYRTDLIDCEAVAAGLDVAELSFRISELAPVGPFDKQQLLLAGTVKARLELLEEQIGSLVDILKAGGNKP